MVIRLLTNSSETGPVRDGCWTIKRTDDVLYATFDTRNPDFLTQERAVLAPYASSTKAVSITSERIDQILLLKHRIVYSLRGATWPLYRLVPVFGLV